MVFLGSFPVDFMSHFMSHHRDPITSVFTAALFTVARKLHTHAMCVYVCLCVNVNRDKELEESVG